MIKLLKHLFVSDWETVWGEDAYYTVECYNEYGRYSYDKRENCFYFIQYSKKNDMYRLKTSGYRPLGHQYYGVALKALAHFNKLKKDK